MATSELEGLLDSVLALTDLPAARDQHPLPGQGPRSGLVDRAYPEAKLIVEADGRRWHGRYAAMGTDRQRDFQAARVGWQTIRLLHEDLTSDPDEVAVRLVETYRPRLTFAA